MSSTTKTSTVRWVSGCQTGKRGFFTKADAKLARGRGKHRGLSVYPCTVCPNWHLGHLPALVRQGVVTRADIYPPDVSVSTAPEPSIAKSTERQS